MKKIIKLLMFGLIFWTSNVLSSDYTVLINHEKNNYKVSEGVVTYGENVCTLNPNASTIRKGTSFTQTKNCVQEKYTTWLGRVEVEKIETNTTETAVGTRSYIWVSCASENNYCRFNSSEPRYVRYGTAGRYKYKWINGSGVSCTNGVFGDPFVGQGKYCWYDR